MHRARHVLNLYCEEEGSDKSSDQQAMASVLEDTRMTTADVDLTLLHPRGGTYGISTSQLRKADKRPAFIVGGQYNSRMYSGRETMLA